MNTEERTELARRFKYYHRSVRPTWSSNMVETVNGTFFALNSAVELLDSRIALDGHLQLSLTLAIHFLDERLLLRELPTVISLPGNANEFEPWLPALTFEPNPSFTHSTPLRAISLDPKSGQLTVEYSIHGTIPCDNGAGEWKYPFETWQCEVALSTSQDERLFLRSIHDLRSNAQFRSVNYEFDDWSNRLLFRFSYRGANWLSTMAHLYLPSLLAFIVSFLVQLRHRRKTQVMVTVIALLSLILLQQFVRLAHYNSNHHKDSLNLADLWLCGLLLHVTAILSVDMLLPARRISVQDGGTESSQPRRPSTSHADSGESSFNHQVAHRHQPHSVSIEVVDGDGLNERENTSVTIMNRLPHQEEGIGVRKEQSTFHPTNTLARGLHSQIPLHKKARHQSAWTKELKADAFQLRNSDLKARPDRVASTRPLSILTRRWWTMQWDQLIQGMRERTSWPPLSATSPTSKPRTYSSIAENNDIKNTGRALSAILTSFIAFLFCYILLLVYALLC